MLELLLIVVGACGVAASIVAKIVYMRRGIVAESKRDTENMDRTPPLSKPGR